MKQRMIRVTEASYWALKGRAVVGRVSVSAVVEGLVLGVSEAASPVVSLAPVVLPRRSWVGPFPKPGGK